MPLVLSGIWPIKAFIVCGAGRGSNPYEVALAGF
jgi:hypothetical protein